MSNKNGPIEQGKVFNYDQYNSSLVDYEYDETDPEVAALPDWVKDRTKAHAKMKQEIDAYNATKPKKEITMGTTWSPFK